jgi:hypothetical protein
MKNLIRLIVIFIVLSVKIYSQSISVTPHDINLSDTLGTEMIFAIDVTNISDAQQTVYIVRTINELPEGWTSSLCFDACFANWLDSIVTAPEFNSSPLQVGETREVAVHVFPLDNPGQGNVQVKIGATRDAENFVVDLTAVVNPTSVDETSYEPGSYKLLQNYPNPFNPSTKIKFTIPASPKSSPKERTFVELKIYDVLGNEIATLVNEEKSAGEYEVKFSGERLSSGMYFYTLRAGNFAETKKMILLK